MWIYHRPKKNYRKKLALSNNTFMVKHYEHIKLNL